MEKRAFITGASGMIGSYILCNLLRAGYAVRALVRPGSDLTWLYQIGKALGISRDQIELGVTWIEGDLDSIDKIEEGIAGVDYVYHCAAMVSFKASERDALYHANVYGTRNLVNVCIGHPGIKKFLYMSSIAALSRGSTDPEQYIDERSEWEDHDQNTDYAQTKFLGEMEVWRGSEEGLPVVILNPGFVLGFGNPHRSSSALLLKIRRGARFYTRGINGFVDVSDVAALSLRLMEGEVVNERFVVVAYNLSYSTLFKELAKVLGAPEPKIEITPFRASVLIGLLKILEWLGIRPSFITSQSLRTAVGIYRYSSAKLKQTIHFEFTPFAKSIERIGMYFESFGGKPFKN